MRQNNQAFCESVNAMTIEQRGEYLKLELAIDSMIRELDNLLHHEKPIATCGRPLVIQATK